MLLHPGYADVMSLKKKDWEENRTSGQVDSLNVSYYWYGEQTFLRHNMPCLDTSNPLEISASEFKSLHFILIADIVRTLIRYKFFISYFIK